MNRWLFVLLFISPILLQNVAFAQDSVDGEEEGEVKKDVLDSEESTVLKAHPDASTHFMFTKPTHTGLGTELPAGKDVSFLVGFLNNAKTDLTIETMEASFRYAMDFSYHLQNFSAIRYNKLVKPGEEATVAYQLRVSDAYSARPYGFTVNLNYKDAAGKEYVNAVFNETVNIIEVDEGLDLEILFLYLLMAAIVGVIGFAIQQYFFKGSKRSSVRVVETGTSNSKEVDYDWIPKDQVVQNGITKSPKQSPRQRKVKRSDD